MSSSGQQSTSDSLTTAQKEFELCRLAARLDSMWKHAPKDEGCKAYEEYVLNVRKDLVSASFVFKYASSKSIHLESGVPAYSSKESPYPLAPGHLGDR